MPKYFGTDGVRGKAGSELTVELALALSQAAVRALRPGKILLARDTRLSGPALSAACSAGLANQGGQVFDAGILPSPVVSHLVPRQNFSFGLVISASHNPPENNGLKFYNAAGYKLSLAEEKRVETEVEKDKALYDPPDFGEIKPWPEAVNHYFELLRSIVRDLRLSGLRLVLDCGYGATSLVAPSFFQALGASLFLIGDKPDGTRINLTGAAAPTNLQEAVRELHADLGIAFDGDGDRALFVDEEGEIVEGDRLMAALGPHLLAWGEISQPAVVFTVLANLGTEIYLRERGFAVLRVPVGDRNVAWMMREKGIDFGGEPAGHIIFRRYTVTGDGILSSLLVLSYLARLNKSLRDLVRPVSLFPQVRLDVPVVNKEIIADPEVQNAIEDGERRLKDMGRLVVRPSGTQPVIRIMAEGPKEEVLQEVVEIVAAALRQAEAKVE